MKTLLFNLLISVGFLLLMTVCCIISKITKAMNHMNVPYPSEPDYIPCRFCSGEGCIICDYYGEIPVTGEYLDDLAADKADEWYDNR